MGWFRPAWGEASLTGTPTSITGKLPPVYAVGEHLVAIVSKDGNASADIGCSTSGWASRLQERSNNQIQTAVFVKQAASTSETPPVFTTTVGNDFNVVIGAGVDFDGTDPIHVSNSSGNAAASAFSSDALTTTLDDCTLLWAVTADGNGPSVMTEPGPQFVGTFLASGAVSTGIAWTFEHAAGPAAPPSWQVSLTEETNRIGIAFKNASGGRVPAYLDPAGAPGDLISALSVAGSNNGLSFPASLSALGTIGSKTTLTFDAAATLAGSGIDANAGAVQNTPPAGTAVTTALGYQIDLSPTWDLTAGPLAFSMIAAGPNDAKKKLASLEEIGALLVVADASLNWRAFHYCSADSDPNAEGRVVAVVNCNQTTTMYAQSATPPNIAAIAHILFLESVPGGSGNFTASWSELQILGTLQIAGGDSANPITLSDLGELGKACRLPIMQRTVSSLLCLAPLQIGGNDPVHLNLDGFAVQNPRNYSPATGQINFHRLTGSMGITVKTVNAADECRMRNGVLACPSRTYLTWHSSCHASSTHDYRGLTIINRDVALAATVAYSGMTFSGQSVVTQNGAAVDACAFTDSLILADDPAAVSGCTFTSSGTGHGMEITAPGTYTFDGNLFTGYAASDGSTGNEAIYNNSGGAVTINVTGGGNTPSVRNGAGATTTVNAGVTLRVTVLDLAIGSPIEGARVFLKKVSGGAVIFNALTNASGIVEDTAYNYTSDEAVIGWVRKASAAPFYVEAPLAGTITAAGYQATASMIRE